MSTNREASLSTEAARELLAVVQDFLRGEVDEVRIRRSKDRRRAFITKSTVNQRKDVKVEQGR